MKFKSLIALVYVVVLASCSSSVTKDDYIERGSNNMDQKQWKSAIIEYKNAIKLDQNNIEARVLLGKAYLKTYSSDAAIKEFNKAIALGLNKKEVLVFLGKAYSQSNKNDRLINEIVFDDTLTKEDQVTVLALRAGALMSLKELDKTLQVLEKAKLLDINNTDVRLMWAKYESRQGDFDAQIKWLKPLLAKNIADAWSQMANVKRIRLKLEASEAAYTKAISIRQLVHQDYMSRALIRIALKKYDEAKADLTLLKGAGLSLPTITHSEGMIAYHEGDWDIAQLKFDEVLGKYKNHYPSLFVLGLVHYQKKNYESAIKALIEYLQVIPQNDAARMVLATSFIQLEKYPQAIVELEKLRRKSPNAHEILSLLGGVYLRDGQLAEGLTLFKQSVKQNSTVASTQFQLGAALVRDKKTSLSGQQALVKAINLDPKMIQANLTLYLSYMDSKLFEEAGEIAKIMIEMNSGNSLAYNLSAHAYWARGEKIKAIEIFEMTLVRFPSDPLTSGNLAKIRLKENKPEEARLIYLKVLDEYPGQRHTLINMAVLESKLGNQRSKMKYLEIAVEKNPTVLSSKVILATEYIKLEKYQKASDVLRKIAINDQAKLQVQILHAKIKMGLSDYDYALLLIKKLIADSPNSAIPYFLLGQNYGYLKQNKNMKVAMERAIKLQPDYYAARIALARLALLEGNMEEFEARIELMNNAYPNSIDVKFLHAKLNSVDKDYSSAIATLEELLNDVSNAEIIIDLSKNKWVSGDKDGAIAGLELWLDDNPNDKKALILLAQFYGFENRTDEANFTYSKVNKLIPNNAAVLNNMAWIYRDSNVTEGIKLAKKALFLEPDNAFIKDTLAMLLLDDDNPDEALKYSKQAAKDQPDFIEIQINYAKILVAVGKNIEAKSLLINLDLRTKTFDQGQRINTLFKKL